MTKIRTTFQSVLLLVAATLTTDAHAQSGGLPILDLQKNCSVRSAAAATDMDGATARCVAVEQKAQAALAAAWNDIPIHLKTTCIKPNDYSPSYVEWIGCLEAHIGVKGLFGKALILR